MANRRQKPIRQVALERQLITIDSPRSPITEQYRTLRTNIEFSSFDQEYKTILVTSSSPGEGKSTTVSNLAVAFAQQGKKVLLIDTDLRKPTVHYTFNLKNVKGLTNVITKQATLTDVIQPTEVEHLTILTCGPIPPNPAELLGSEAMSQFIELAKTQYDIVLFDTPPILAVADTQILANKVDGTILVISSGNTEQEAARKSKDLLASAKGKIIGAVLNMKKAKDSKYYYYYGGD
ncbi:CpsD/CapB family tyrosine-protein kinase [Paenisporosarcina sp. TG-14]|uniref:CpsD/CapB family tyrosine-protein kinase n=1 Tax=Paenisporosarcina sp. TG-14 TaxID=1231057 RepID=UPI0002E66B44|nr:CpsD/CapB family tyrosine-protein kinase [Paenisporosarcina sp. TG-14]